MALLSSCFVVLLYFAWPKGGNAELPFAQLSPSLGANQSWAPGLTPVSSAVPLSQQGSQVVLNGQTISAMWSLREQRVGIADVSLMQALGVELLNTADAARQPVQWFSNPTTEPLVLSTWLTGQYRYLEITDLARRAGWQVQPDRNLLRINTPTTRVMSVRQGRQTWGDRIVLDLDRSAPWQISEQSGEIIVTVAAQADPSLIQNFQAGPGNRLNSLRLEANASQTRLRVGVPTNTRPHVWTLTAPNRLVVDIHADYMAERDVLWAPGIRWQQRVLSLGSARFPVVSLTVDPRQAGLVLKPIWSNPASSVGIAPLATTAQRWQAVAAINGGFFNRNNQLPLGAIRQDRRWISGPILNRGAIAWNEAGDVGVGRLSLGESVITSTGQAFPILAMNSGYVQAGIARYSSDWGTSYTPIIDNEIIVTIQNNRVVSQRPAGPAGQNPVPIPTDGYLLVTRAYSTAANALTPGTTVRLEAATAPSDFDRYSQIMGAGPLLVQNRQIVLNAQAEQFSDAFTRQAATRSAIGKTAEGKLILSTVHTRQGGPGPTLAEMAQIMQQLGAVDALNLDGGSSTTLYLGGRILDRSPLTAARVHNGIGIFIQPGS